MCEHKTTYIDEEGFEWCSDCREEVSGRLEIPTIIRQKEKEKELAKARAIDALEDEYRQINY